VVPESTTAESPDVELPTPTRPPLTQCDYMSLLKSPWTFLTAGLVLTSWVVNMYCLGRTVSFMWYRWGARASVNPTGGSGTVDQAVGEAHMEYAGRVAAVAAGVRDVYYRAPTPPANGPPLPAASIPISAATEKQLLDMYEVITTGGDGTLKGLCNKAAKRLSPARPKLTKKPPPIPPRTNVALIDVRALPSPVVDPDETHSTAGCSHWDDIPV
jgi:hypothetical protein